MAGVNAARLATGREPLTLPIETMMGALAGHITAPQSGRFQPMNANFGLIARVPGVRGGRRRKREAQGQAALEAMDAYVATHWRER
jgi:methylenetetrahydrofolate--tRNA-(uracil-5-)-methyltransferase